MNREKQIETLNSYLTGEQARYLSFEDWETLPTEKQLEDWLPEFLEEWDTPAEWVGENTDRMCRVIAKLDDAIG